MYGAVRNTENAIAMMEEAGVEIYYLLPYTFSYTKMNKRAFMKTFKVMDFPLEKGRLIVERVDNMDAVKVRRAGHWLEENE